MSAPSNKIFLLQELQRLKSKKSAVDDRDIKQALQLKIDSLQAELTAIQESPAEAETLPTEPEPEILQPSTPDQIRQADELIRQANLEKIRKNAARALTLMKEAAAVAPNSPAVLEALGDDYASRKQFKDARDTYARAMKFAKANVELERKHATSSLRARGMSMFDSQMRMDSSDPLFLSPSESRARVGAARFLNALIPGLGQLVVGKTIAGFCFIGATVFWIVWLALMGKDVDNLLHMIVGKSTQPNLIILFPIFGYLITWFLALLTVGGDPPPHSKLKALRPEPPVNLPFE